MLTGFTVSTVIVYLCWLYELCWQEPYCMDCVDDTDCPYFAVLTVLVTLIVLILLTVLCWWHWFSLFCWLHWLLMSLMVLILLTVLTVDVTECTYFADCIECVDGTDCPYFADCGTDYLVLLTVLCWWHWLSLFCWLYCLLMALIILILLTVLTVDVTDYPYLADCIVCWWHWSYLLCWLYCLLMVLIILILLNVLTADVTDYPYFVDCVDDTDCTDFADCTDCWLTIVLTSDCSDSHCLLCWCPCWLCYCANYNCTVLTGLMAITVLTVNCADCIGSAHCIHWTDCDCSDYADWINCTDCHWAVTMLQRWLHKHTSHIRVKHKRKSDSLSRNTQHFYNNSHRQQLTLVQGQHQAYISLQAIGNSLSQSTH